MGHCNQVFTFAATRDEEAISDEELYANMTAAEEAELDAIDNWLSLMHSLAKAERCVGYSYTYRLNMGVGEVTTPGLELKND